MIKYELDSPPSGTAVFHRRTVEQEVQGV